MAKAKEIVGIDCDGPPLLAITQVLKTRMEEMCAFREAALDGSNPEGVHDMRVGSRRLRTALRDFAPGIRTSRLTSFAQEIKLLARTLGRVRDQDVAIIALKKASGKAPPQISDVIIEFVDLRQRLRDEASQDLAAVLNSLSFASLSARFEKALSDKATRKQARRASWEKASPAAMSIYRAVARSTILAHLKDLENRNESFYRPNKLKPLHKTRISAKRLRYSLELFGQCWEQGTASFAKDLSAIQSALGEVHDCDLWIKGFEAEAILNRRSAQLGRKMAVGWLIAHFAKLRTKNFRKALKRWNDWKIDDSSSQLRAILREPPDRMAFRATARYSLTTQGEKLRLNQLARRPFARQI